MSLNPPDVKTPECLESTAIAEVQLLLAEKRTSLAALRTGIVVFSLPLSVLGLLVATSRYYDVEKALHFLLPLLILSGALVVLGTWLCFRSIRRLRHEERLIQAIKAKCSGLAHLIAE
jgi:uncharacterized membrane protein YidH (DUF202 family)